MRTQSMPNAFITRQTTSYTYSLIDWFIYINVGTRTEMKKWSFLCMFNCYIFSSHISRNINQFYY